jgi:hypothetical protein
MNKLPGFNGEVLNTPNETYWSHPVTLVDVRGHWVAFSHMITWLYSVILDDEVHDFGFMSLGAAKDAVERLIKDWEDRQPAYEYPNGYDIEEEE